MVLRVCQIVLRFFTNESVNSAPKNRAPISPNRAPILTASANFNFSNFESLSQQFPTTNFPVQCLIMTFLLLAQSIMSLPLICGLISYSLEVPVPYPIITLLSFLLKEGAHTTVISLAQKLES